MHPHFEEVGRSGARYTRVETIAALASEPSSRNAIMSDGFEFTMLGEDAALPIYRAAERATDGDNARHAHRCSLWLRAARRWRVRYRHAHGRAAELRSQKTRKPSGHWAFDISFVGVRGGTKMRTGWFR